MAEPEAAPPAFDVARLVADLRKGDEVATRQAYRVTFGHEMGRLVLGHFLKACGVGEVIDPECTDGQLRYLVGQHNAAIELARMAGYDQAHLISEVFTDQLEENPNDRHFEHGADGSEYLGEF